MSRKQNQENGLKVIGAIVFAGFVLLVGIAAFGGFDRKPKPVDEPEPVDYPGPPVSSDEPPVSSDEGPDEGPV
jgi:hypothetical protein